MRVLKKPTPRKPWVVTDLDVVASLQAQQQRLLYGLKATTAAALVGGAKARAKAKGVPYDLDEHVVKIQARLDAGLCELTGVPFRMADGPAEYNSPSIDRIVPEHGYVYSNIRIICHGMNCALGNWGEGVLFKMIAGLLFRASVRHLLRIGAAIRDKDVWQKRIAKCETLDEWRGKLILNVLGLDADTPSAQFEAERDYSDVA